MNFWQTLPKPFTVLAPMEEVTDIAFRNFIAELGRPNVFFTEFTSCEGMQSRGRKSVEHRLRYNPEHHPIVAQIWGTNPEAFAKTAAEVVEMGFDGVDINMGCPVKKIVKNGACARLIDNPSLAKELIQATKEAVAGRIGVSVKTRIGFRTAITEEWCGFLLEQGLDALTVHGRLAKDLSKYPADWNEVAKVVQLRDQVNSSTLIIGNGDVINLADAQDKHRQYKVDGVMIGRGIFKDPFAFTADKSIASLNPEEKFALLLRHATLFDEAWGNSKNFSILRRFFKIYMADFDGAADVREALMQTQNLTGVFGIGKQFGLAK